LALFMITEADPKIAILIMGVFSIAYTVFGGIAGLVTAGVFAADMSSVDSALNSRIECLEQKNPVDGKEILAMFLRVERKIIFSS
jgi:Na+/proline symporter